jgi:hypothetical protein
MKKILIGVLVLLLLFTASVYFFIPENITVSSNIISAGSVGSAQRATGSNYRKKWFPKEGKLISQTEYVLDDCSYRFGADNSFSNDITVKYKHINAGSLLTIIGSGDSVIINWRFGKESGYNPVNRLRDHFALKHFKETNEKMLQGLKKFLMSRKNVYGFDVELRKQTDSTLISIKRSAGNYPTAEDIYINIEKLKRYAAANGASANNAPMLNIENDGTGKWMYMVALPINKALNDKGDIIAKRMFAGGRILVTENINGGFSTIDAALRELEKFRTDYGYMSPAIPFQSLVTDRTKEPDSSKWLTKLYYPVY